MAQGCIGQRSCVRVLRQRVSGPLAQTGDAFMRRSGEEEEGLFRTSSQPPDEDWTEKPLTVADAERRKTLQRVLSMTPAPAAYHTNTRS